MNYGKYRDPGVAKVKAQYSKNAVRKLAKTPGFKFKYDGDEGYIWMDDQGRILIKMKGSKIMAQVLDAIDSIIATGESKNETLQESYDLFYKYTKMHADIRRQLK